MKKSIAVFVCALFCATLYYFLCAHSWTKYANVSNMPCKRSDDELSALIRYAHAVVDILADLAVPHYLMYGSLWGALRYGGPLPWDYDVDIGVDGDAISKYSRDEITTAFSKRDLVIEWSHQYGRYRVVFGDDKGIDVMPFYEYWRDGMMRRRGVESWVFFVNYRRHHTFPARLVRAPLPVLEFGGRNVSVPRGGIEIQKYTYRDDWYRAVPPIGCKEKM